ncbi:hypothetical protein [Sagittula sp. MA-2]|jgi:TRAP-type C4-dicarboxylate transport system permease small subunit|uniref:hypothetical protein n=1 Tax=Sagittula sp. MA-2 TaxID=3048007 RepID=UPI0024C46CA2|nr:hypothetical protein [Sagittula sp. MA-2]WHZ37952.1 hypothetical protein QNI11_24935 [Sagittula sp. MA-2]
MKQVDKIATIAACAIFVALYVLVLAQMLGRSVGVSLLFAEDLISILFIWFVMGGAVVAYIRDTPRCYSIAGSRCFRAEKNRRWM